MKKLISLIKRTYALFHEKDMEVYIGYAALFIIIFQVLGNSIIELVDTVGSFFGLEGLVGSVASIIHVICHIHSLLWGGAEQRS